MMFHHILIAIIEAHKLGLETPCEPAFRPHAHPSVTPQTRGGSNIDTNPYNYTPTPPPF